MAGHDNGHDRRKFDDETKKDYYGFKEAQIAKNAKIISVCSVVGLIFLVLMFFVRSLNSDVHAMEAKNDTVTTDVAVIKQQIKNINEKFDMFEKSQEKMLLIQQKILDEI